METDNLNNQISNISTKINELFNNRADYRADPDLLDIAQSTLNEKLMYEADIVLLKKCFKNNFIPTIFDFCSGTGSFTSIILNNFSTNRVTCIDNDINFINKSKKNILSLNNDNISFYNEDATYFSSNFKADLILMGSAYHHIADDLKTAFLENAKKQLKKNGFIIVNENFLPDYSDVKSYKKSIYIYFKCLIEYLEKNNTPAQTVNILRQCGWFGYNMEYEYKVSYSIFKKDCINAGLQIIYEEKVWPSSKTNSEIGNIAGSYVLLLTKI